MIGLKTHLALLIMSFVTWAIFVIIGLPDYYPSWSFGAKTTICVAVTMLYFPLTRLILEKIENKNFFENSLWLAPNVTIVYL